jgi:hypothetical protein
MCFAPRDAFSSGESFTVPKNQNQLRCTMYMAQHYTLGLKRTIEDMHKASQATKSKHASPGLVRAFEERERDHAQAFYAVPDTKSRTRQLYGIAPEKSSAASCNGASRNPPVRRQMLVLKHHR